MGNKDTDRASKEQEKAPLLTLTYPGWRLTTSDPRGDIEALLGTAEDALVNALHALTLFEQTQVPGWGEVDEATLKAEEARYKELAAEMVRSGVDVLDARLAVDAMFDRERWARGQKPKRLPWRLSLIYARSFMYSLNRVRRLLSEVAKITEVPQVPGARLEDRLPDLTGVRDSSEHLDERVQGLVRGKPLSTRILLSENLAGHTLVSTMGDGKPGRVEVCRASVEEAVKCVQAAINALAWMGPRRVSYLG